MRQLITRLRDWTPGEVVLDTVVIHNNEKVVFLEYDAKNCLWCDCDNRVLYQRLLDLGKNALAAFLVRYAPPPEGTPINTVTDAIEYQIMTRTADGWYQFSEVRPGGGLRAEVIRLLDFQI